MDALAPRQLFVRVLLAVAFSISTGFPSAKALAPNSSLNLDSSIRKFSGYIIKYWNKDPRLKQSLPPQIITNISSSTEVLGGCFKIDSHTGQLRQDIGGTSFCPVTNTIFVVQEELLPYYEAFGGTAVGYVIAHEYGHYLQSQFKVSGEGIPMELQADCLAGAILGQGFEELDIKQKDILAIAAMAYSIGGSQTHGTGAQRAYAAYTGLGQANELTCSLTDMNKLAQNKVMDPNFLKMKTERSFDDPLTLQRRGPYLRPISAAFN